MRDLDYTFSDMNSTLYPLFLSLGECACVVAGLGPVGCRKLAGLLAGGARDILVLERRCLEQLSPRARALLAECAARVEQRDFAASDARPGSLVFAATSDKAENLRIAQLCRQTGAFCNCATDPPAGNFLVPATARKGKLTAALSTAGQSPALAAQWRGELEKWLAGRERIAWLLGRLRAPVLALGLGQEANAAIFWKIAVSQAADWLANNENDKCRDWLNSTLPGALAPAINKTMSEYAHVFR